MRVCILGGAGFIGRRIVRLLVAQKHDVVALDINSTSFDDVASHAKMERVDATQFEAVLAAFARHSPEAVINLSFMLPLDRPRVEALPRAAFNLNILGMDNCLEAARICRVKHVVYASSIAVNDTQTFYGLRPILETDQVTPSNQYSTHKVFNEWQAHEYREKHGMCITGIRAAHVNGPDKMLGSVDHVEIITKPAKGEKVALDYRDWMRCLIHVEDAAEVFARVALAEKPKYPVYNSGGETLSLGDLADMVKAVIPEADITFEHQSGGAAKSRGYIYNNDRLVQEFGIKYMPYKDRVRQMIGGIRGGLKQS
jgi:nucleoside-diphosphate-sugar epimerase